MTYDEALKFLASRIDYERMSVIPYGQREFQLDRMLRLLSLLDDPHIEFPVVHVAGTKGKGSTAAMIAAALQASGYRVGLYSSPHLERVEERWQVDGQVCTESELIELVETLRPAVEAWRPRTGGGEPSPTFFELTTALGFLHFVRREVDLAVVEVGMGGRLDSTNVCQPCLCVITTISLDHTQQLGTTTAAIAREKAGIIKPGVPVVSGVCEGAAQSEIADVCRRLGSRFLHVDRDFGAEYRPPRGAEKAEVFGRADIWVKEAEQPMHFKDCELGMLGAHQADNAAVAAASLMQLRVQGLQVEHAAIRRGLRDARCPARIEVVRRRPTVVLDAAHNVASVAALCRTLDESFSAGRRTLIFGGTRDKDLRGMLELLLSRFERCICTNYRDNPRAVPAAELAQIADELGSTIHLETAVAGQAWRQASASARSDDLFCICGSFYLAAELRREIAENGTQVSSGAMRRAY